MMRAVAGAGGPHLLLEPQVPTRSWSLQLEPVVPTQPSRCLTRSWSRWCPTPLEPLRVSPAAGAVGTIGTRKTRAWDRWRLVRRRWWSRFPGRGVLLEACSPGGGGRCWSMPTCRWSRWSPTWSWSLPAVGLWCPPTRSWSRKTTWLEPVPHLQLEPVVPHLLEPGNPTCRWRPTCLVVVPHTPLEPSSLPQVHRLQCCGLPRNRTRGSKSLNPSLEEKT
jgi:hypothetical protein